MEFKKVLNDRHSVRDFKETPIKIDLIKEIVQEAQKAPSWVNSQPWKVYATTGKTLENIKQAYLDKDAQKGYPDFPVMHREDWSEEAQANMKQWRHEIVHHFDDFDQAHEKMSFASSHLYSTPAMLFITIPKNSSKWSIFDAGAFSQTLMLAAQNKGLDTIPNYTSVRFPDVVRKFTDIPDDETLVVGIAIGYAQDSTINTYRSKRVPVDDILKIKD